MWQDLAVSLQRLQLDLPGEVLASHPSQLRMGLSNSVIDHSVSKRLLTCAVAALRAHGMIIYYRCSIIEQAFNKHQFVLGSSGCHVQLTNRDTSSMELYSRLGFIELKNVSKEQLCQDVVYFGRIF